ncbi:hypothetical protein BH10BAC6_BH10BAC6_18610 [soil metagenome]
MKFSSLLKGAAVTVALLAVVTEAQAQLPVRTTKLQLINGANNVEQVMSSVGTAGTYQAAWPSSTGALLASGTGFLLATKGGTGNNVEMTWVPISGSLLDGLGAAGQIAYFTDPNTIASDPKFTISGGDVTVGAVGGAGSFTIVNATVGSKIVNGGTTANTLTIPEIGVGGVGNFVISTGQGTTGQVLISAGAGLPATWQTIQGLTIKSGSITPAAAATSGTIIVTGISAVTEAVVSGNSANGLIVYITSIAGLNINWATTVPCDGTERICWFANGTP